MGWAAEGSQKEALTDDKSITFFFGFGLKKGPSRSSERENQYKEYPTRRFIIFEIIIY